MTILSRCLSKRRKAPRLRHRNSLWLCNLLILAVVQQSSPFVLPDASRWRRRQHHHDDYTKRRVSDVEVVDAIDFITSNTDQQLELNADTISGSINVTNIEFAHHGLHQPLQSQSESTIPDDESILNAAAAAVPTTIRSLWRRRNARTAEEGIRRETTATTNTHQLSNILARADELAHTSSGRRYGARTIMGLIHALAEEAVDLDVQVDARPETPLWGKHVDAIRIKFSRLGFKPLRMGGLDQTFHDYKIKFPDTEQGAFHMDRQLYDLSCADEAFERIDVDNSGALDSDEIAEALVMAARSGDETEHRKLKTMLKGLASELVALYDFNGDGVVDRKEYQTLVEDMASLKEKQEMEQQQEEGDPIIAGNAVISDGGWFAPVKDFLQGFFAGNTTVGLDIPATAELANATSDAAELGSLDVDTSEQSLLLVNGETSIPPHGLDVEKPSRSPPESHDWASGYSSKDTRISEVTDEQLASLVSTGKDLGSITISDLKMDLRRLFFGAIPLIKHITPGGPLVLEPFTMTITASFNTYDIKNSFLLDAGLRRLVAQAIRRRVRSLRDTIDGAVFYGRSWKMSSKSAPLVEVIAIEDVDFDSTNRLILTGRVRVQTSPDQPVVENAFKLRAKLGTNAIGRRIRLVEPELALVLECPKAWESIAKGWCDFFNISGRQRPKPLYFFFPIYSPFKLEDVENDGFDLGEDNQVKSIYIQDKALRFELSAVLRPGRFLGNHYLAFTIPNRTFIITLDRVKEGIRAARKMKLAAKAVEEAAAKKHRKFPLERRKLQEIKQRAQPKSFFSRFVDGYIQSERDGANSARVTRSIRDFFGRQSARLNKTKAITLDATAGGSSRLQEEDDSADEEKASDG